MVAVEWKDAHQNGEEVEVKDVIHRPWFYTSVGRLLISDDEGVTLVMDTGEDGNVRTRGFIPRGMVVRMWDIGPVKPKRTRKKRVEPPSMPLPFGEEEKAA